MSLNSASVFKNIYHLSQGFY